jgi:N-acetylmuramoyl-L-alanine amidase
MATKFQNPWGKGGEYYPYEVLRFNSGAVENSKGGIFDYLVASRKEIVIVIDPGHGNTIGNTGSVYIMSYKHKVKDEQGKALKNEQNEFIIQESLVDELPEFIKQDDDKESSDWVWVTERIYDQTKTERDLVWNVALSLSSLLNQLGYTSILTRNEKIISGPDNRTARINVANVNNANYFLSIHADGSLKPWISGSNSIYRLDNSAKNNNQQKEFADDCFFFYRIVKKGNTAIMRNDLQVLSPTLNKTPRKCLVELGFVTNTMDYEDMLTGIESISNQIARGIERNICRYYFTEEVRIVGFEYGNRIYKSKWDANRAFEDDQRKIELLLKRNKIDGISGDSVLSPKEIKEVQYKKLQPAL